MEPRNLASGAPPLTAGCSPPQHFATTLRHYESPPQYFEPELTVLPYPHPPQLQYPSPPLPLYFACARTPPQPSIQPRQQSSHCLEIHGDHRSPQRRNSPPPQAASERNPAHLSASPEVQGDHQPPQQDPSPPLKLLEKESKLRDQGLQQQQDCGNCQRTAVWAVWDTQQYVYRSQTTEDPFRHSRSLRHQQPSNPRRKRNDDDHSDEPHDENGSELDEEYAQEKADREEKAYKKLIPQVKQLITEIGVGEKWTMDREEKICMVCTFPVRMKGWKALLQHAETCQKRKPVEHRAYFRVLTEQLKQGFKPSDDENFQGKALLIERGNVIEPVIVWPPVVIIDNIRENESLDLSLPELKPSDVQRTIRFSRRGLSGVGRMLVVFPATEVGHLNSIMLVHSLAKLAAPIFNSSFPDFPHGQLPQIHPSAKHVQQLQGLDNERLGRGEINSGCSPRDYLNSPYCSQQQQQQQQGQKWIMVQQQQYQPSTGFLAQAADMQVMDPRRNLVKWSVEKKREILKCVLKKAKQDHELGKAKVRAKMDEVDDIAESHQQFKHRKTILCQQLQDAEMALRLQKKREDEIAKRHAEQLQIMDEKFEEDIRRLEVELMQREGKLRQHLEANEKQLEAAKVERRREVDILVKYLDNVNQEQRNQIAQKALEKENETTRKRAEFNKEIKLREMKFNEESRNLERNLIEKQESEKMKFLEKSNKMRQEFLNEWVAKQAALKEEAEKAKQEKDRVMKMAENKEAAAKEALREIAECSVCFADFLAHIKEVAECSVCFADFDGDTKRALIQPCGHAQICLPCASYLYSQTKLCPICRVKLSSKPKAMPKKLYM